MIGQTSHSTDGAASSLSRQERSAQRLLERLVIDTVDLAGRVDHDMRRPVSGPLGADSGGQVDVTPILFCFDPCHRCSPFLGLVVYSGSPLAGARALPQSLDKWAS
jgi:hypothetical protein